MRILTVTSIYPTDEDPGLGAFVASQVESLQRRGLQVDVLFMDVRNDKSALLKGIGRIRNKVRHYDLIHAHFGYNGIPAVLQDHRPVVLSLCGTDLVDPRIRPLSRWAARRADARIVKSREMLNRLQLPASVVPNGVDTHRFRPDDRTRARERLGLQPDTRYALFAADPGRPEKRYALANETVRHLRGQGVPTELLILNKRPHRVVPSYLNAVDLLLLTSTHEGSPNVIKEAMACNLPIVSTDVGDVRQLLGDSTNCVISDPTVESLAKGISKILAEGCRSNGRDYVTELSVEKTADRLVQIYRKVVRVEQQP